MAKFYTKVKDKNWYLEMFEKYTGQRIKSTETWGNHSLKIILQDPEANEQFSTRRTGEYGGFYQLRLDLDTGTLEFCDLPGCNQWSVAAMYEAENPGVEVMEVQPSNTGWYLSCRSEN